MQRGGGGQAARMLPAWCAALPDSCAKHVIVTKTARSPLAGNETASSGWDASTVAVAAEVAAAAVAVVAVAAVAAEGATCSALQAPSFMAHGPHPFPSRTQISAG